MKWITRSNILLFFLIHVFNAVSRLGAAWLTC